jgi:hypothetical protein
MNRESSNRRSIPRMAETESLSPTAILTDAHTALLNHYFPGDEREIGMRIIGNILNHLPMDSSAAFGTAVAQQVRSVYVMLRHGMRDKPLLDPEAVPGFEHEAGGLECIYLAEALVLLALASASSRVQ